MASQTPTVLLVAGAFTTTHCYDSLVPLLEHAGYPTAVAAPPSANPVDPDAHTAESDGKHLLEQHLLPLIEVGREVVVFAHSFGATALSGAAHHLSRIERSEQGLPGGIIGLIYMSFALAPDGKGQIEYLGGAWPPFCKLNHPSPGVFIFEPAADLLFNDTDPETAAKLAEDHLPHSMRSFETPVSQPLWTDAKFEGRRVMIKTLRDATFPVEAQQMFADGSGVGWEMREVDGGHEVFLTQPKKVADVMLSVIIEWC